MQPASGQQACPWLPPDLTPSGTSARPAGEEAWPPTPGVAEDRASVLRACAETPWPQATVELESAAGTGAAQRQRLRAVLARVEIQRKGGPCCQSRAGTARPGLRDPWRQRGGCRRARVKAGAVPRPSWQAGEEQAPPHAVGIPGADPLDRGPSRKRDEDTGLPALGRLPETLEGRPAGGPPPRHTHHQAAWPDGGQGASDPFRRSEGSRPAPRCGAAGEDKKNAGRGKRGKHRRGWP